jgi:hypothetical protein
VAEAERNESLEGCPSADGGAKKGIGGGLDIVVGADHLDDVRWRADESRTRLHLTFTGVASVRDQLVIARVVIGGPSLTFFMCCAPTLEEAMATGLGPCPALKSFAVAVVGHQVSAIELHQSRINRVERYTFGG